MKAADFPHCLFSHSEVDHLLTQMFHPATMPNNLIALSFSMEERFISLSKLPKPAAFPASWGVVDSWCYSPCITLLNPRVLLDGDFSSFLLLNSSALFGAPANLLSSCSQIPSVVLPRHALCWSSGVMHSHKHARTAVWIEWCTFWGEAATSDQKKSHH